MALAGPHDTHLCSSLSSSSSGLPGLLCPTCLCTPAPLDTTSAFWCLLLTAACCCTTWRLAGLPLARLQARLGCWLATVLARLLCWPPAPHRPACNTCMPLQALNTERALPGCGAVERPSAEERAWQAAPRPESRQLYRQKCNLVSSRLPSAFGVGLCVGVGEYGQGFSGGANKERYEKFQNVMCLRGGQLVSPSLFCAAGLCDGMADWVPALSLQHKTTGPALSNTYHTTHTQSTLPR